MTGREAFGTCHVLGLWDDGDIVGMISVVTQVDALQLSLHIQRRDYQKNIEKQTKAEFGAVEG